MRAGDAITPPISSEVRRTLTEIDVRFGHTAPETVRLGVARLALWLKDNSWLRQPGPMPRDLRWP
jgi:hypothetical protein